MLPGASNVFVKGKLRGRGFVRAKVSVDTSILWAKDAADDA